MRGLLFRLAITNWVGTFSAASRIIAISQSKEVVSPAQRQAERIVQQLRQLTTPLPAVARSDGSIEPLELRRRDLYPQLRQLGPDALPALAKGLKSPDIRLRKVSALL